MFDFIKDNLLAVIAVVVAGIALFSGGSDMLGVSETTTFTNPVVFDQTVAVTGATTFTGATTLSGNISYAGNLVGTKATTSTTTVDVGKVCYFFTTEGGTEYYGYYTTNGVWATTTTSCS